MIHLINSPDSLLVPESARFSLDDLSVAPRSDESVASYLYIWNGHTLYAALDAASEFHDHYTASVTVSLDGPFTIEVEGGETIRCEAIFIGPNIRHRMTAPGQRRIVVQFEPDSDYFHPFSDAAELIRVVELSEFRALFELMRAAFERSLGCGEAQGLFDDILRVAAPDLEHAPMEDRWSDRDPRVTQVIEYVDSLKEWPAGLSAAVLAESVGLSTERFRHLFKEQMGMPIRRWLLWIRLKRAGRLLDGKRTLTQAALGAGFYDSAHLSRTCKEMLGLAPSFFNGDGVKVRVCDAFTDGGAS